MNNDSTGFMNYQSGLLAIEPLAGTRGADTFTARLNTDSVPMLPTDPFGAYTEPSFATGYAPIVNPAFGIGAVGNSWEAVLLAFAWFLHSPPGDTVTIYGWWYQDDTTEDIVAAGNLPVPFVCPPTGTALSIGPININLGSCSPSASGLLDGGFEAPIIPAASFTTLPTWPLGSWTSFGSDSTGVKLASTGAAYEPPTPNPEGAQYLILQGEAGVYQQVSIGTPGTYRLSGARANRLAGAAAVVAVLVDGVGVDTFAALPTSWEPFASATFSLSAGSHTIGLLGLLANPPIDSSMFFDMLSLLPVP